MVERFHPFIHNRSAVVEKLSSENKVQVKCQGGCNFTPRRDSSKPKSAFCCTGVWPHVLNTQTYQLLVSDPSTSTVKFRFALCRSEARNVLN